MTSRNDKKRGHSGRPRKPDENGNIPAPKLRPQVSRQQKQIMKSIGEYSAKAFAGQIIGYFENDFMRDLNSLKPKDRVDAMIRLARYVYPVLNANVSLRINSRESNQRRDELMQLATAFGQDPKELLPEVEAEEIPAEE